MKGLIKLLLILTTSSLISTTPLWLRRQSPELTTKIKTRALADYQLPKTIKPLEYELQLIPYIDIPESLPENKRFTFDGSVIIKCVILEATDKIIMHAYDMDIIRESVTVKKEVTVGEDNVAVTSIVMTPPTDDRHFLTINLATSLEKDQNYFINITFTGKINDGLEGFYRSSYTDSNGNKKWLGVTQFQPSAARRAFPCFDEPEWRAQFSIQIAHPSKYKVLANMPAVSDDILVPGPYTRDWTFMTFQQSVSMPTYLVAFSINEFESITNAKFPRFKLWARPEAVNQGHYSNDVSPKIVSYMTDFTQHPYSLPKVDQIAIPDFSAGAMENWGLITYRETALLFQDGVSTSANRQRVETVVTHELAHQWFGNLVTLKWWDTIWMNEGFATYFEYHALAEYQDTWQLERQFILDEMHVVFQSDALESTHAMLVPGVESPEDNNAVFNNIAYNKGGCMVRFLIKHMGENRFKSGIKEYISKSEFGSVVMKDLWDALQAEVGPGFLPGSITLEQVMDTWTKLPGYPVVSISRNYTSKKAAITQKRFWTLPPSQPKPQFWIIPLTYTTQIRPDFDDTEIKHWFMNDKLEIDLQTTENEWVIFNTKQIGYYRVNYDVQNWRLIIWALGNETTMNNIDIINRAQIMDDALALARAKLLDYTTALDTTVYLTNETDYMPWAAALRGLAYLNDRLTYDAQSAKYFQTFMLSKLSNIYELVNGFTVSEDDSHIMRLKRTLILGGACNQGHVKCNQEAKKLFDAWEKDPALYSITPDLKSVVYCSGMKQGKKAQYDFLFTQYEASSNVASEQALILSALGCASDTMLLESYLNESIKDVSKIRTQDARNVITAVYNNPIGVDVALDFLLNNWAKTSELYESIGSTGRVLTGLSTKLNTLQHRNKLSNFLTTNNATLTPQQRSTFIGAINTVDITLQWHANHREEVLVYLGKPPSPSTTPNYSSTTVDPTDIATTILISPILLTFILIFSILF